MATQIQIPETIDAEDAAIENAAEVYVEARDKRMELTKVETGLRDALLATLKDSGKETYRRGPWLIYIEKGEEKPKVKIKSDEEAGE